MRLPALLALIVGAAPAATPEQWASMHDGRLSASLDRDVVQAAAVYEALLGHMAPDDPVRAEVLYWLGRARYEAGDAEGAKAVLQEAIATPAPESPTIRSEAAELLALIQAWERRIAALPYVEEPQLQLRSDVSYRLIFEAAPQRAETLHLRLRAEGAPGQLNLELSEQSGSRWTIESLEVPAGEWTELDIGMADFQPLSEAGGSLGSATGGGRQLWTLSLEQVASGSQGGTVFLDRVEVR